MIQTKSSPVATTGTTGTTGATGARRGAQVLERLRDEQEALSTYFAGGWTQPIIPSFRFIATDGLTRLEGCLASLICGKRDVYDGGDHWLVVVEVRRLHRGIDPLRPLIFYRGKYRRMETGEGTAAPDLVETADEPAQMYHHL
jgi:hypothetical protein